MPRAALGQQTPALPAVPLHWARPQWPDLPGVAALVTARTGGCSRAPWNSANLGTHVDDAVADVTRNRAALRAWLPADPVWLRQVHSVRVHHARAAQQDVAAPVVEPEADAVIACEPGVVCGVLVADCLPVLLADAQARGVGAVHAGWRGLAGGVIQEAVLALRRALGDPAAQVLAYLGPAIGPQHFVVGPEVLAAMEQRLPAARSAFAPDRDPARYRADLFALARMALAQVGVGQVSGGGECTYGAPDRYFSYRRDGHTGRQGAFVWLR